MAAPRDVEIQRASVYGLIMGLWNNGPAHAINPRALREALNMRVEHLELRTSKGYSAHMATPVLSAAAIRGMKFATRSDGTQDHLVAVSGGYWKIASNGAKTLISKGPVRGTITDLSAGSTVVAGDTDCRFTQDVSAGDYIWLANGTDDIDQRVKVASVSTNSRIILVSAWAGTSASGAYETWDKQADKPTSMKFWNDKWYFANKTQKLMEWDGTDFQEVGMPGLSAGDWVAKSSDGTAEISASTRFYYGLCWEDANGGYGNSVGPIDFANWVASAVNQRIVITNAGVAQPAWATKFRVYRGVTSGALYYLQSVAVSSSGTTGIDNFVLDPSVTELIPEENYQPPAGLEHLEVYHDRLCAVKQQYFYCSGHLPTDIHSWMGGSVAGRYQPEVWRTTLRIGHGERNDNNALAAFRGQFFILGSRSTWQVMAGSDNPDIWEIVALLPNVGSESRQAIAPGGDVMFWLGRYNGRLTVFSFNARAVKPIGEPVWGSLSAADPASLSAAAGGVGEGFYWLTFKTTGGYKTIEYNTDRGDGQGAWSERDWRMVAYCRSETEVYAASASGVIHQLEDGYDAAGSDITRRIQTAAFDSGSPTRWNGFRRMFTEIEAVSAALVLSGWARRDESAYTALAGYPISAAHGEVKLEPTSMDTVNGRRLQLKYSSVGKQEYAIRGFEIEGRMGEVDMNR